MSFDFESDNGEHMMPSTYGTDPVMLLFTIRCSVVLSACTSSRLLGWVSVLRDPFGEVSIDISTGGLCDSSEV